jgi:hypothetical protein
MYLAKRVAYSVLEGSLSLHCYDAIENLCRSVVVHLLAHVGA